MNIADRRRVSLLIEVVEQAWLNWRMNLQMR